MNGKSKGNEKSGIRETLAELFEDFQFENRVKNFSEMPILFYDQNLIHFFRCMNELGIYAPSHNWILGVYIDVI